MSHCVRFAGLLAGLFLAVPGAAQQQQTQEELPA